MDAFRSIGRCSVRCVGTLLGAALTWSLVLGAAQAQGSEASSSEVITLAEYMHALAERRLLAEETGSVERMRALVQQAEAAYFAQRWDDASLLLYEVVESPRFADFADLEEFRGASYMLAGALTEMGALRSASRYLERILTAGPEDPYFGPAVRRFVDVALRSGEVAAAATALEDHIAGVDASPDAQNELRYLQGRAAYDADSLPAAEAAFAQITRRSRFYANAHYLRGVIATRRDDLTTAEAQFCSIATTDDTAHYTFYVDDRYFAIKDLAWLALGRVAHEGRRADDAFYYYFQIPNDSTRVSAALFEAAWSMYEGDDQDTALDLLDQLSSRFPSSPFVDEAGLLRAYVHLGRCEFEVASEHFDRYEARFRPMLEEIDRVLASPARQARLEDDLLNAERRAQVPGAATGEGLDDLLLALLTVDPRFYRLHTRIRTLDAEAGRAGRLSTELGALRARLMGGDRPRAAAAREHYEGEAAALARDLEGGRSLLANLTEQLDTMRDGGATEAQLSELEAGIRQVATRLHALERHFASVRASDTEDEPAAASADGVEGLMARDERLAHRLPTRVAHVREGLVSAASGAALHSLRQLRARIAAGLRRARIGKIDAVMGSKRRIEIQIESLAAGRFPPELMDPLSVQGLLREDEEYWPFEGEYWSDEFEEHDAISDEEDE